MQNYLQQQPRVESGSACTIEKLGTVSTLLTYYSQAACPCVKFRITPTIPSCRDLQQSPKTYPRWMSLEKDSLLKAGGSI